MRCITVILLHLKPKQKWSRHRGPLYTSMEIKKGVIVKIRRICFMIVLMAFLSSFICFFALGRCSLAKEGEIIVCLRYDDYSSLSNRKLELALIQELKKYGVPCTFGVIPFVCSRNSRDPLPQETVPLNNAKATILRDAICAGVVEAALHGYSHETVATNGGYSEFSGVPINIQASKIEQGKAFLESLIKRQVVTFIPPWNRYDENTLLALERLGFETISANDQGPKRNLSNLTFLPATCHIWQLKDLIKKARHEGKKPVGIIALFHPFDFVESDDPRARFSIEEFRYLLNWLGSQSDIRLLTIAQASHVLSSTHFRLCFAHPPEARVFGIYLDFGSLLPDFIKRLLEHWNMYLSVDARGSRKCLYVAILLAFHLIVALVTSLAILFMRSLLCGQKRNYVNWVVRSGGPILLLIFLCRALGDFALSSMSGGLSIDVSLGICIGGWLPPFIFRKP